MNKTQFTLAALKDDTSIYLERNQPYYFISPGYNDKSAGIRLLHRLCSLLNQLGFEAYVESPKTDGNLWTPQLTKTIISAHYRAGKKPIVIYPEVVNGQPLKLGLPVRYMLYYPGSHGGSAHFDEDLIYCYRDAFYPGVPKLQPPALDTKLFHLPAEGSIRDLTLVYYNRYNGPIQCFADDQLEISSKNPVPHEQTGDLYRRAKIMYAYEESAAVCEARVCGCPVVLVPNRLRLPEKKDDFFAYGHSGLAWGLAPEDIERARNTAHLASQEYFDVIAHWRDELLSFIQTTQEKASATPFDTIWPDEAVDGLPDIERDDENQARRADRIRNLRLEKQYEKWRAKTTLRELDAQEYAEHWVSPDARPLTVLIDCRGNDDQGLADTVDSIAQNLGQPAHLVVCTPASLPDDTQYDPNVTWVGPDLNAHWPRLQPVLTDWLVITRAGDKLDPRALAEWSLHLHEHPDALLLYSDEDLALPDQLAHPFFKPDLNVELLKCTNYIGSTVVVNTLAWKQAGCPTLPHEIYAWALGLSQHTPERIVHVDHVLFHAAVAATADDENAEFTAITTFLAAENRQGRAIPRDYWGTWLINYAEQATASSAQATLVVPTGIQTGYLSSLLESIGTMGLEALKEVILICRQEHRNEVEEAQRDVLPIPVRILCYEDGDFNYARTLNQAVAAATTPYVVVADDDTELLHSQWLYPLLGLCAESGVGCVAPRLMSTRDTEGRVCGGPMVLGIQGSYAPYNGESGGVYETGPYSRLQLTQDVSAVTGHFFAFKRSDWDAAGGFDEKRYPLRHGVVDFCLRLGALGKRHVWTPLVNVVHHGGKTLETLCADPHYKLAMADVELSERARLVEQWASRLANDPCYNRHLSLLRPYDIESDIIIDWQPGRASRTKVLALPVHSGAGQYRVIEPLDALQDAGLIRSCLVSPMSNRGQRILQPLELLRAHPDVLYLQYAMSDLQLVRNAEFKKVLPTVRIVQSVDDLYGNVPDKHPSRTYQQREGHRRMMQAISSSDQLIVTTEPLREHYSKYIDRVDILPNAVAEHWLQQTPRHNAQPDRLRIGWVGAQQHRGDQELIRDVIEHFADAVDWVFMGMCIDDLKPFVKEVHPFVSIAEYPAKMAELGLDIAIAPLEDNAFNRCKSNLRLLEYGALGWPVVCSDVYPYRTDDPPVLRCNTTSEWIEAIQQLIDNSTLRHELAQRLHDWVKSRYRLKNWLPAWAEALKR